MRKLCALERILIVFDWSDSHDIVIVYIEILPIKNHETA